MSHSAHSELVNDIGNNTKGNKYVERRIYFNYLC